MQLLGSPASPFVRKVRALLAETGHEEKVQVTAVTSAVVGPVDELLTSTNPSGKIPALIRPDGPALYDSRVICRFLDSTFDMGMYPKRGEFEMLTLEATADAIMDASLLMVYEARFRPSEHQDEDWVEGQWRKVSRTLDAIEARWMSHLSGPLDMSHLAMACALGYLDLRHEGRGWRTGRPTLAAWCETVMARPSLVETAP